jgi:biotin-(acetyl-CoA carboxylase) ligase
MDRTDWRHIHWPDWIVRTITWLESVDSTNSYLANGSALKTCPKAHGDRRNANTGAWKTGKNLVFSPGGSILRFPSCFARLPPAYAQLPTLIMAAAAAGAIQHRFRIQARVKWPNDIQIEGRKIGEF